MTLTLTILGCGSSAGVPRPALGWVGPGPPVSGLRSAFDLVRLEKHRTTNSTPATPAVALIYALDRQLDRILEEEGLENRFARHSAMAARTQEWALSRGFGLYAPEGYRSQTVTTIAKDPEFDLGALNAFLLERGMRVAGGQEGPRNALGVGGLGADVGGPVGAEEADGGGESHG